MTAPEGEEGLGAGGGGGQEEEGAGSPEDAAAVSGFALAPSSLSISSSFSPGFFLPRFFFFFGLAGPLWSIFPGRTQPEQN